MNSFDVSDSLCPPLPPSSKPGSLGRLAHYEILAVIGQGGFGTVLKAFDEKLHRVAAIKVAPFNRYQTLDVVRAIVQRLSEQGKGKPAIRTPVPIGLSAARLVPKGVFGLLLSCIELCVSTQHE